MYIRAYNACQTTHLLTRLTILTVRSKSSGFVVVDTLFTVVPIVGVLCLEHFLFYIIVFHRLMLKSVAQMA